MCFLLFGGTILFIFLPLNWFGSSYPKKREKKKWFGSSCEHIARLFSDSLIMDMNGFEGHYIGQAFVIVHKPCEICVNFY